MVVGTESACYWYRVPPAVLSACVAIGQPQVLQCTVIAGGTAGGVQCTRVCGEVGVHSPFALVSRLSPSAYHAAYPKRPRRSVERGSRNLAPRNDKRHLVDVGVGIPTYRFSAALGTPRAANAALSFSICRFCSCVMLAYVDSICCSILSNLSASAVSVVMTSTRGGCSSRVACSSAPPPCGSGCASSFRRRGGYPRRRWLRTHR